jgi:dynactin 1
MVMLDEEVAEERAELAESEMEDDIVKKKLAILEVEHVVLKEGSIELSVSFCSNTN